MFSGFQVAYGRNQAGQGDDTLVRVPVRYGDASRQAQTIIQNNSANDMPSTPLMTFHISDLSYDRPRIQDPSFVSTISVRQRTYDQNTDSYETTQGNAFNVERYMPVPYKLTIKLDIWTSNTNQKLQLLEQILPLINPSLEIQSTDSYLDWTSLSVVDLENVGFTSRTIPVGTEDPIDIATITFSVPIWLSLPAKVKKLGVVERFVAGIFDSRGDPYDAITNNDLLLGTRQCFTPYGYQTLLIGNKLQALRQQDVVDSPNSSVVPPDSPSTNLLWTGVVGVYGVLRPGISLVALEQEDSSEVFGTVAFDPTDDRFLLFTVQEDTVPANTLTPVDAVINPLMSGPGAGLPPATNGQRYLLTEATGTDSGPFDGAWAGTGISRFVAQANDIIEYVATDSGGRWVVSFVASTNTNDTQYVTNITSNIQYKWTGEAWVKSYQGLYPGGKWRLIL
jgi:hypothetical protein